MTLSAFAAARRDAAAPTVQQSIARRAHSSKPAARCCRWDRQTDGQTDRRTPCRYTVPAPHTMRPLPILCREPADSPIRRCSPVCFEFFGVIQHKKNFFVTKKNSYKKTTARLSERRDGLGAASDLQSTPGRRAATYCVATLGKLFTPLCRCHQAV